jgi:hypothetical protein
VFAGEVCGTPLTTRERDSLLIQIHHVRGQWIRACNILVPEEESVLDLYIESVPVIVKEVFM